MIQINLCIDCKNLVHLSARSGYLCQRAKDKMHPVWGKQWKYRNPVLQRLGIGIDPCGRKGKYFVKKGQQP
jgi:hypothetical protein